MVLRAICGPARTASIAVSAPTVRSPTNAMRSRLAPSIITRVLASVEASAVYALAYQARLTTSSLDRKWPV
jgi:hypothetical protein